MRPAVAKVPSRPSERIGAAEARNRRQPMSMPPLKRMTISATTAIRSTVTIGTASYTRGQMSETTAAASRKIAGAGTGTRSVSVVESAASAKPAVTIRTMAPKSLISVMAIDADQTSRLANQEVYARLLISTVGHPESGAMPGRPLKSIGKEARSPRPPRARMMKRVDISSPSEGFESHGHAGHSMKGPFAGKT